MKPISIIVLVILFAALVYKMISTEGATGPANRSGEKVSTSVEQAAQGSHTQIHQASPQDSDDNKKEKQSN